MFIDFNPKNKILKEEDDGISSKDVLEIKGENPTEDDSFENTDISDPNLDDENNDNNEEQPSDEKDMMNNDELDDSISDNENQDNELKNDTGNDENKKVKLYTLYKSLSNILKDISASVNILPYIDEEKYIDIKNFVIEEIKSTQDDLNYIFKYKYLNTDYFTLKKLFLDFKFIVIQLSLLIHSLFIYCKNRQEDSLGDAYNAKSKIKDTEFVKNIREYFKKVRKVH